MNHLFSCPKGKKEEKREGRGVGKKEGEEEEEEEERRKKDNLNVV